LFLCRLIDSSTSASVASRMALYKFDYYYYYYLGERGDRRGHRAI